MEVRGAGQTVEIRYDDQILAFGVMTDGTAKAVADDIRKVVERAVAEEREACAKLAEEKNPAGSLAYLFKAWGSEIAEAIRARGKA